MALTNQSLYGPVLMIEYMYRCMTHPFCVRALIIILSVAMNAWALDTLVRSESLTQYAIQDAPVSLTLSDLTLRFAEPDQNPVLEPNESDTSLPNKNSVAVAPHNARTPEPQKVQTSTHNERRPGQEKRPEHIANPLMTNTPPPSKKRNPFAGADSVLSGAAPAPTAPLRESFNPELADSNPVSPKATTPVSVKRPVQNPIVNKPRFKRAPEPPRYPVLARKRGQQGTVWLEIWLDDAGKQIKQRVISGSGFKILDEAAISAVSTWRFLAHEHDGIAVASRVRIPIEFSLN